MGSRADVSDVWSGSGKDDLVDGLVSMVAVVAVTAVEDEEVEGEGVVEQRPNLGEFTDPHPGSHEANTKHGLQGVLVIRWACHQKLQRGGRVRLT